MIQCYRIVVYYCIFIVQMSIELHAQTGDPYIWPHYNPTIDYNFKRDNPTALPMPEKDRADCNEVGTIADGWWTFKWGSNKNALVTEAAIRPLLARMNKDFAYFRDSMGWPPDKRAKEGYRSAIYLYGSGLCTDNESNTALGGWQSSISGYPMVLLSYYPVYSFDPKCTYNDRDAQMGACVHEGIHSVLADLPGCKQAAWFHEGGNTWLQQQASAQQTGNFSGMGFLNGVPLIAPFIPIECYSGWLQDGSFGGPSAEGVNMTGTSGQICTWRTFLGGAQYGNIFPTFLGEWLGVGAIPWIWKNCPSRVLEGMAVALGETQIRRLICEYRAKCALCDFKRWSNNIKSLLSTNMNKNIGPEWEPYWINCETWKATPYVKTTNDGTGLLTPESRTTPGWSGANLIPLKISGISTVSVNFQPIGQNMTCQLCYRAVDGTAVYSQIVSSGDCVLRLDKQPQNSVVIAVICNTDYKYLGDVTRKSHYDYRLKIGSGITTADIYSKWFDVNVSTEQDRHHVDKRTSASPVLLKTSINESGNFYVTYILNRKSDIAINLYTVAGRVILSHYINQADEGQNRVILYVPSKALAHGISLIEVKTRDGSCFAKISH